MKRKMFFYAFLVLLVMAPVQLPAADFDWMPNFNVQVQADPSGFHALKRGDDLYGPQGKGKSKGKKDKKNK